MKNEKTNRWQDRIEAEKFLAELLKQGFTVPPVYRPESGPLNAAIIKAGA